MDDKSILVAVPHIPGLDNHTPDSEIRLCGECGDEIWVSQDGLKALADGLVTGMRCMTCAGLSVAAREAEGEKVELACVPGQFEWLGEVDGIQSWMRGVIGLDPDP